MTIARHLRRGLPLALGLALLTLLAGGGPRAHAESQVNFCNPLETVPERCLLGEVNLPDPQQCLSYPDPRDPTLQIPTGGLNPGIAFDGANLIITCLRSKVLDIVPACTDGMYLPRESTCLGSKPRVATNVTVQADVAGLGAAAWDATRGRLWVCGIGFIVNNVQLPDQLLLVSTADGSVSGGFPVKKCHHGVAFDGVDDTLWIADEARHRLVHYTTTGTELGNVDLLFPLDLIGGARDAEVATGGPLLFLGNNTFQTTYAVKKDFKEPGSFIAHFDANRRIADLECDDQTFLKVAPYFGNGDHTDGIWVLAEYSRIARAYEMPKGYCQYGGGGRPLPPKPAPAAPVKPAPTTKPIVTTKVCASRRNFLIRLRKPSKRVNIKSAKVIVGTKAVKVTRRKSDRRFVARVDLRRSKKTRVTVKITIKGTNGRTYTDVRRYYTCNKKLAGGTPRL